MNSDFIPNLYLPPEILTDTRLNLRHIRTLMAIFSWRKSNTNLSRVSRAMLSERTGYPVNKISAITSELATLGWVEKLGNGGRSQWCEYRVKDLQKTLIKSVNPTQNREGFKSVNPTRNGEGFNTLNPTQIGDLTLPDLGRGIDTAKYTAIKSSSNAQPVDNFDASSVLPHSNLRDALANFKNEKGIGLFSVASLTSPRFFVMLNEWKKIGVEVDDIVVVFHQVLARSVDLKSPLYLDGPMKDWLKEKSGEGNKQREKITLPKDDNALEGWARKNGYSKPKQMDSYFDYRHRLRLEIRERVNGNEAAKVPSVRVGER